MFATATSRRFTSGWARRPLAACRAFIDASLANDPETDAETGGPGRRTGHVSGGMTGDVDARGPGAGACRDAQSGVESRWPLPLLTSRHRMMAAALPPGDDPRPAAVESCAAAGDERDDLSLSASTDVIWAIFDRPPMAPIPCQG